MQEISSITKENEIDVIYGMLNLREERELARASVKYILTDMSDIRRSFIRLGFHLYEFERMHYYEDFGYTSIVEFAEKNLGLSKSQVSIYKNIYLEFGDNDGHSAVPKMYLADQYKEYSYSQLREMLPMNKNQRKQVKPDMTIEQIRTIKKSKSKVAISQLASGHKEKFSYEKHSSKTGIVAQNYVKNAESLKSVCIHLYSRTSGKRIDISGVTNVWCSLLESKDGHISLRLWDYDDPVEETKK